MEGYSPALLQKIVDQGGRYAFAEAALNLSELAGVRISAQHVLRLTERIGREWAQRRDAESEAFKQGRLPRAYTQTAPTAVVMLDGGRALTRAEPSGPGVCAPQWKQPNYACCLTQDSKPSPVDPQPEPPTKFLDRKRTPKLAQQIQYVRSEDPARAGPAQLPSKRKKTKRARRWLVRTVVATMGGVAEVGAQVAAEVYRRGLDRAKQKGCVADGQGSNWTIFEQHLKPLGFIAVLDFLHLLSYLYAAAQAAQTTAAKRWTLYERWLRWAWSGQRDKLLVGLNAAVERAGPIEESAPEAIGAGRC